MFLVTIDERNGEFEYTHLMLVPSLVDFVDTQVLEDFYGEGSVANATWRRQIATADGDEEIKGFYWIYGERIARVASTQPLTDDETITLRKFL